MTDLRPTHSAPASGAHGTPAGVRALTVDELGHLDRARAHLRASGVDLTDAEAVGTLLHSTRTRWAAEPGAPLPQAMVMALGVGVGDLVVARVPGSRWALRTAGSAPSPAVVSLSGEDAALPLADVATRWRTGCTPTWVGEYVAAAAAHLMAPAAPEVPTPRVPARTAQVLPSRRAGAAPLPDGTPTCGHAGRRASPHPRTRQPHGRGGRRAGGRCVAALPCSRRERGGCRVLRERCGRLPDAPRRRPGARCPERGAGPAGPHVARVGVSGRPAAAATPAAPPAPTYRVPADLPTRRPGARRTSPSACSTRRSTSCSARRARPDRSRSSTAA